ncbi:NifU-like protein [Azospirillum brasilense]|uniref:NifU-like protein n=1 Tax=Azospirillum brasilense TaxID=192 RepID=A0A560BCB2_AZOBR|nr:NifU family protein [Azospirillum brasilense]TWA70172.1 NifU-like protein [Azospirillum brasilense]
MTTSLLPTPSAASMAPATDDDRLRRIAATIEEMRPMLQNDGGDMELVEVSGDVVRVGLRGACVGCGMAGHTLGAVRRRLVEVLGTHIRVLPAPLP